MSTLSFIDYTKSHFMRGAEQYECELGARDVWNRTSLFYGTRSFRPRERHNLVHVTASLRRRAEGERLMWAHLAREHGVLSRAFARATGHRLERLFDDSLTELRAPERAVSVEGRRIPAGAGTTAES